MEHLPGNQVRVPPEALHFSLAWESLNFSGQYTILLIFFSGFPLSLFLPLIGEESKKKKKSVSWAEEGSLVNIHYFEMDESERGRRAAQPYMYIHYTLYTVHVCQCTEFGH